MPYLRPRPGAPEEGAMAIAVGMLAVAMFVLLH
jgi:hypothetical protein